MGSEGPSLPTTPSPLSGWVTSLTPLSQELRRGALLGSQPPAPTSPKVNCILWRAGGGVVRTVPLAFSGFPRLTQPSAHMCVVLSHQDIRTAKCTQEFRELKPNVRRGLCLQRPEPLQRERHRPLQLVGRAAITGVCLSMDHRGKAGIQGPWNHGSVQRPQERNQDLSLKSGRERGQGSVSFLKTSPCCLNEMKVFGGGGIPFTFFYLSCVYTYKCT